MSPPDDTDRPGAADGRRDPGPERREPAVPEGAARRRDRLGRGWVSSVDGRPAPGRPAARDGRPGAGAGGRPGASRRDGERGTARSGAGRGTTGRTTTDRAPAGGDPGDDAAGAVRRGGAGRWPVPERSVLATVLGVPPAAAVAGAAGLTLLGVLVDLLRLGRLGTVFTVCYVGGCVLAVAWVRRRSLFGPMVQPPLLPAAAVPLVVLLAGPPRPDTGVPERLLTIGAPLVNSFPTMAWTTAGVLALGAARLLVQRVPAAERAVSAPRERDAAPGAGRTSASPGPS